MTTLEFIKSELLSSFKNQFQGENIEIIFGELSYSFLHEDGHTLECVFEDGKSFIDGEVYKNNGISNQFTIGFKTPKGYISSKKVPVSIVDKNNITIEEVSELLNYNTDAVRNTFDPFYKENEAKRRSNIGWNYVASNYLQEDCR